MIEHTNKSSARGRSPQRVAARGVALNSVLQLCLLILVLGQIVFLASRYRVRLDLTSEGIYTLTESTQNILDKLEDRLYIEAYFSPDDQLSRSFAESRQTLRNLLDEYVQNSNGRVVVRYFDPQSDNALRERAERLGIKPQTIGDRGDRTLSYKELWQGLHLRYGGKKRKVIPQVLIAGQGGQAITAPYVYEHTLTPAIKALTVTDKPVIAFASWPSTPAGRGAQPAGFDRLRAVPEITERYDIRPVQLETGALINDDVDALMLVRPKDLSDRSKFVVDQFLMRGGKLIVFADTDDYSIEQQRMFNRRVVSYDAKGSTTKFLEQMGHYGVDLDTTVLVDLQREAMEALAYMPPNAGGLAFPRQLGYPYFFHPINVDWGDPEQAAALAQAEGDPSLAEQYEKAFEPGVSEVAKGIGAPGMFWPCPVELAEPMPEGLSGEVLLRTSPRTIEREPPQTLSPFDRAQAAQQQAINYRKFLGELNALLKQNPRRQHGLMVSVTGKFSSYFADKDAPMSPERERALAEKAKQDAEKDADATEQSPDEAPKEGEGEEAGPPAPEDDEDGVPEDPAPLTAATAEGMLVVIGDSDFIRDDLITGAHGQLGPISRTGPPFFLALLDWIAEDQELFALRNKITTDRSLSLIDSDEAAGMDQVQISELIKERRNWLQWGNIIVPPLLLLAFGLVLFVRRRVAKRAFLETLEFPKG